MCRCGIELKDHVADGQTNAQLAGEWKDNQNTKSEPTDAYGTLRFFDEVLFYLLPSYKIPIIRLMLISVAAALNLVNQ